MVVALCCGQTVHAQHDRALERALQLDGASRCVTAATLRARIADYLGSMPVPNDLTIEVELSGGAPQFRLLRAGAEVAERRFAPLPAGCAERRDAIAIAIAVALEHAIASEPETPDPALNLDSRVSTAAPRDTTQAILSQPPSAADDSAAQSAANQAPPPAAAEPEHATRHHERPRRPQQRFMLHAGAVYFLASLPSAVAALAVGAEYALVPELRIGLTGLVSESGELAFEGGRVEHRLFGGQATACWNSPLAFALVHACAGGSAAYVHAQGFDYAPGRTTAMLWLAGIVRGAFELPISEAFAVRVAADGRVNLSRPNLHLERPGAAPRTRGVSPVGISLGADVVVRLE